MPVVVRDWDMWLIIGRADDVGEGENGRVGDKDLNACDVSILLHLPLSLSPRLRYNGLRLAIAKDVPT